VSSQEIHHLLDHYGLITVFLAVFGQALFLPIPGSTVLIAAAVYAASGHGPGISAVIATASAGVTLGGVAGFGIGRWRGEWALLRLGRLLRQPTDRIQRLRRGLDRHAGVALIAARWFTGTRNLAGIAAGASAIRPARFGAISLIAAVIWATVTALEFYFFGGLLLGAPTWLQVLVIILGLGLAVAGLALLRRRMHAAEALGVSVGSGDERGHERD
jgi:membrane protein DedA with SNARE-associated domain